MIRGYVESLSSRPGQYGLMHSMKVDNVNYGTKSTMPPCRQGDFVEFSAVQNAKGYWDADAKSIKVLPTGAPAAPAPVPQFPVPAPGPAPRPAVPYVDRNDSIVYQSSRKDALQLLDIMATVGTIDFGKAKNMAAKQEILEMHLDKLTQRFIEDVKRGMPPEHPAEEVKVRKAKAATEEFEDDDIPF